MNNENKPKTLREGLNRLRDPGRGCGSLFLEGLAKNRTVEDLAKNLADILEILIVMGFDTDGRSLDIDVTNLRPTEPEKLTQHNEELTLRNGAKRNGGSVQ